ncbi:MAG: PD-(D/E)XK nuclease family protein, partial [Chloroflexota bacterium]
AARTIAAFIASLDAALRPPADLARWADFVAWARGVRDRFVGTVDRWTGEEGENAVAVDAALGRLGDADRIDSTSGPSATEFIATLDAALYSDRRPTGRPGRGILIEPIAAVAGLAFDRVYVLGLREGVFPPPPAVDPFFPVEADDPLGRRARQHAEERRDFLMALATADHGKLTLCVPDSDGARAAFPSRWLLDLASARARADLDATRFAALDPSLHPWLRVVYSARHGVARDLPPADLEDRRLRQAVSWVEQRRALDQCPMARREDLPLGRALRLADARRSARLTPWDGNLSSLAGGSRRLSSIFDNRRALSASAVQTWATCGFRYFLERVIGVEPTERPAESWTIDSLDRGALIHRVLNEFLTRLRERGRPRPYEDYTSADAALIEQLAREQFTEIEARGAAGHDLAWEITRSALVSDLRAFLAADQEWRRQQGLNPAYLEQEFGASSESSWPALGVSVPVDAATRTIRFRGKIDRIDCDPTGENAYLFDYKTGSAASPRMLEEDPVAAGRQVQLALYKRAARNNLPRLASVGGALWFVTAKGEFKRSALPDDLARVDRRLDEVIGLIARGIASGAFPQVPGKGDVSNGFDHCRFCDFERICPARRDQIWSRKQDDPLAATHRTLAMTPASSDAS